jgi:cell division protease FtsH
MNEDGPDAHAVGMVAAQVTNMARQMVVNYGFSDIGPWSLLDPSAQSGDMIMRMMARNGTSESLQRRIDEAVKKIAAEAYEVALSHIRCAACMA